MRTADAEYERRPLAGVGDFACTLFEVAHLDEVLDAGFCSDRDTAVDLTALPESAF